MNINQIIKKHESGTLLTESEIEFSVNSFLCGQTSESQMSQFLLSIAKKDLTEQETFYLTKVMLNSGEKIDLSAFSKTIDKHSTGGVSDSTTLIVVPLFALFGFTSIKMSGGGLGHTGGTADKMKVFANLQNSLPEETFFEIAKKTGACFITSTASLAPADKKIYALRDKINAMSVGLIASSIMSKKLASGSENLILDVKYGNGALLSTKKQALTLARLMKKIGNQYGVNTDYVLGDMNEPLGQCIGDTLEVWEVLQNLKSAKMTRLLKHSLNMVATALYKHLKQTKEQVFHQAYDFVKRGKVTEKLKEIVLLQGGNFDITNQKFSCKFIVKSPKSGIISKIQTKELGLISKKLSQTTPHYVGFKICKVLKEKVKQNETLFECFFDTVCKDEITKQLIEAIGIKHEN